MRKTFKNTLRPDIKFIAKGRGVEVSGAGLTYRSSSRNAQTAELMNSKIPVATIIPRPR